jgi:hypothetical protein
MLTLVWVAAVLVDLEQQLDYLFPQGLHTQLP